MLPNLTKLADCMRDSAREEVLSRFEKVGFSIKQDGSLLTEADLACDCRLREQLTDAYPHIGFLSEEMKASEQQVLLENSEWLWVLDPLDGTGNFASGFPLFCSSLALVHDGKVVQGLTYDPVRDEMFMAERGKGAFLNQKKLVCRSGELSLDQTTALVDFKRLSSNLRNALIHQTPYRSQRNLGTCALEWAWVASNRAQLYVHGGMKLWDLAAGTLIVEEAGGYACTLDGKNAFAVDGETRSAVVANDKQLFEEWTQFINTHQ